MTPDAPRVGEMVAVMRRRPQLAPMLEMDAKALAEASRSTDEETRMLAEVLATMTPGQRALLWWQVHDLTRGPEAPQQGIHREGHDAQHDNFSEGVEAPEVHQHHVDHVGATALAQCPLQEEGGGAFREGAAHHGQRQHRHAPTGRYGQGHVTPAAQQGASLLRLGGGAQIFVTLG